MAFKCRYFWPFYKKKLKIFRKIFGVFPKIGKLLIPHSPFFCEKRQMIWSEVGFGIYDTLTYAIFGSGQAGRVFKILMRQYIFVFVTYFPDIKNEIVSYVDK